MSLEESGILARIRALLPGGGGLVDDCGALPPTPPGETLLVTTDLMESDQHFRLDWHPPDLLARKLLTVNLSDLDASGARPVGYTLTLALGPEIDGAWLERFLEGLAAASRATQVQVLGGDTVGRPAGLGLGLTAFGFARRWLRRDGLQLGDRIFVDQRPGASLRGLRKLQGGQRWDADHPDPDLLAHLAPSPNLGLGLRLAGMPEVHACLDLSDGLSRDLRNLALASGLSIAVESSLDEDALRGGEDYARCFGTAMAQDDLERRLGVALIPVGRAQEPGAAPLLVYDGNGPRPLPDLGFDHFAHD
ncbi:thiamine-monophosphate kinase [Geothrix sp. PMB-07]|uniref:thiamine-phosphate kinase n=1 Tax=Geothrix sp. PMB-07 TaxID=3068640 RepID=UPI002741AB0D|nr:AIR synthase related protein [Geothrix sp. PMB-07]WLT33168.1 AIR synthase related protein [Geothrix sp. PMB-07]